MRNSYPIGEYIYLNGKRYQIVSDAEESARFFTMKLYDEQKKEYFFTKIKELREDVIIEESEKNNLLRESKFRFHYPYIAKVYGIFQGKNCKGIPILATVMEYVEGKNLREYKWSLERAIEQGEISESKAEIKIFRQIFQMIHAMNYYLGYARQQYFHRDLKPDNIMVTGNGDIKIIDFDFAHISGSTGTIHFDEKHAIGFSKGYTSPNVLDVSKRSELGEREDIYSAGRVIFFWLNGKDYFYDSELKGNINEKNSANQTAYWNNKELGYSMKLERFDAKYRGEKYRDFIEIMRRMCCAPDDKDCYKTIKEVKEDIERFLLQYCGNSFKLFDAHFKLPLLFEKPKNIKAKQAPMVTYKIVSSYGAKKGSKLLKNSMRSIIIDGQLVMDICNVNNQILYVPAMGVKIKRVTREQVTSFEILDEDEFLISGINEVRIKFSVKWTGRKDK